MYSVHYLLPELNFTIVLKDWSLQSVWGALHNASLAPPLTAIWVWEFCKKTWCPLNDWPIILMQWQHLSMEEEGCRHLHQLSVAVSFPQEYKLREKKINPYRIKKWQLKVQSNTWLFNCKGHMDIGWIISETLKVDFLLWEFSVVLVLKCFYISSRLNLGTC